MLSVTQSQTFKVYLKSKKLSRSPMIAALKKQGLKNVQLLVTLTAVLTWTNWKIFFLFLS